MKSPIYIFLDLTRIVRVVRDHISIKVRFSFSHETIAEMALFSISRPVKLSGDLIHNDMRYKLRRRIIALIKSGDIQGAGDLSFTDFNLTGECRFKCGVDYSWKE